MDRKELEKMIEAQKKRVMLEQNELSELEQSLLPYIIEEKKKDVGRYFKCRNSYNCPEKESDYWYMYIKITGVSGNGYYEYSCFQVDQYGHFKADNWLIRQFDYGWEEISKEEYDKELDLFLIKLHDYLNK